MNSPGGQNAAIASLILSPIDDVMPAREPTRCGRSLKDTRAATELSRFPARVFCSITLPAWSLIISAAQTFSTGFFACETLAAFIIGSVCTCQFHRSARNLVFLDADSNLHDVDCPCHIPCKGNSSIHRRIEHHLTSMLCVLLS